MLKDKLEVIVKAISNIVIENSKKANREYLENKRARELREAAEKDKIEINQD